MDTPELSFDGGAYQTSYFTAGPDIAYAWKAATKGDLSAEQKPDSTKNAHDAAPKQPGTFPGSTKLNDFMKYFDKSPEDY